MMRAGGWMTDEALGKMLAMLLEEVEGENGFWRGTRDEVPVYVLADESHDRMRIMAPVGELQEDDPGFLKVLLEANFDRALDARYAMRGRELWTVCVHPLATLAPDDLGGFLDQVVRLVKNTGSTFASSDLVFRAMNDDPDAEAEDDEEDVEPDEGVR
jgi:hypothetical protein